MKQEIKKATSISKVKTIMLDSTHICVVYRDNGNSYEGSVKIGTISGDTIIWGNKSVFSSIYISNINVIMLDSSHICVTYKDNNNNNDYGILKIGVISGDIITWNKSIFNYGNTGYIKTIMLDSTHICVVYRDNSNYYSGKAKIGTILDGNIIIWNKESTFCSAYVDNINVILLDLSHICITYQHKSYNNNFYSYSGITIIGTISNDTIIWNKKSVFNS